MAACWAMRKRQKEKDNKEITEKVVATASKMVVEETILPGEGVEVPERFRGRTRMDNVHSRSLDKKIVVEVNELFQPIADEVEEKMTKKVQAEVSKQVNKKVQQNMSRILKKLGEANPNITIDIE